MNPARVRRFLTDLKKGKLTIDETLSKLKLLPFEDIGDAVIDHHRELRRGFPEAILAEGKSVDQIARIAKKMKQRGSNVLITRLSPQNARELKKKLPELDYHRLARIGLILGKRIEKQGKGTILVVCAGTSDLPVAEEAALTAQVLGNEVDRLTDVGVAGVHRLLAQKEKLTQARVLIVVAGMEGALPSVVGGLLARPVIAVPTSVGYGASFQGVAALLSMLNSCVPGVVVVNIDNGYGAGCAASLINKS
ncbi:MAG: nickel pincer cofactor biosynthesis protein LarB [Thermodesulfobacteriota bacterium]